MRDRHIPKAKLEPDHDHFFVKPDRAGVAYGGIGKPDGLDLQQGQIALGIGADDQGGSPEFTRRDHDNAASIGHHVMGGQNIPLRMDDHAASRRFLRRPVGAFSRTHIAGPQEDGKTAAKPQTPHHWIGITTLIAPAFCPRRRPSRR